MSFYFEKSIVIGSGQFAFNCARYLYDTFRLDGIFEYGNYAQSRLEVLCRKNNFKYIKLSEKSECDILMKEIVDSRKRVLIISASNIYIFPAFITECSSVRIINYHPALLSKHLGRNTEAWAIYSQDKVAGVTWHEVTSEIDHGEIITERDIVLDKSITSIKLMIKQYQIGFELFKENIERIAENEINRNDSVKCYGKMHYSYEKPNGGMMDLSWDGSSISAFLRSMDYGNLNVMGRSFVVEEGIKYSWDSYRILEKTCVWSGGENNESDRVLKKDNILFILQNFHKLNDVRENEL